MHIRNHQFKCMKLRSNAVGCKSWSAPDHHAIAFYSEFEYENSREFLTRILWEYDMRLFASSIKSKGTAKLSHLRVKHVDPQADNRSEVLHFGFLDYICKFCRTGCADIVDRLQRQICDSGHEFESERSLNWNDLILQVIWTLEQGEAPAKLRRVYQQRAENEKAPRYHDDIVA